MSYNEKIAGEENGHKQSFLNERKNRFSDRLRVVMKGETNVSFAEKVGVTETTVRRYLANGSVPNLDVLERISGATGYEVGWLASGKGPQKVGDDDTTTGNNAVRPQSISTLDINATDDFVMVNDLSGVEAAAGGGAYVTDEEVVGRMAFRREWIAREGLKAQALRIIRAKGDSMEPTIQDGAPILVEAFAYMDEDGNIRHLHSGLSPCDRVKREGVYVVRLDDRLLVKRLQLDLQGGLLVKSDNTAYDTLHVPPECLDDIAIVGRVVWTGRKL